MRLSKAARARGARLARYDEENGVRRATYCRHWSLITLSCRQNGSKCPDAATCLDYEDAVAYHENRLRQEGRLVEVRR